MDARVAQEIDSSEDYTVTINGDKIIQTIASTSDDSIIQWITAIKRIYLPKRRNKDDKIIVSLHAECNPYCPTWDYKGPPLEQPLDLLQLFIGSHCLMIDIRWGCGLDIRVVKEFLSDPRITFVGVGIDGVVKKLYKAFSFGENSSVLSRTMDLRKLVETAVGREDLGKCGLDKLAKLMLGDEMVVEEGPNIRWFNGHRDICSRGDYTQRKVMYSTIDAFLGYEIGVKCMKMIQSNIDRQISSTATATAASIPA